MRERIEQLVGSPKPTDNHLSAEGSIAQTDDGRLRLKLVVHAGSLVGERALESKSCKDLAGAAAVTLALLMRSPEPLDERELGQLGAVNAPVDRAGVSNPSAGSTAKGAGHPAAADASVVSDRQTTPPSPRRFRVLLQAPLVALALGPLPPPSLGFGLGGGIAYENWRFSLQLTDWLKQELHAGATSYGAKLDRQTASLLACYAVRSDRFEIAPCLTFSLQHLSALGSGNHVQSHSPDATWLAPGVGAQTRLYLSRWLSVTATLNAELETTRARIVINGIDGITGSDEIGRVGAGALSVIVGPEWIF